jgi:hypothetical protein
MEGEEAFLTELVNKLPELKSILPKEFIVDGYWQGEFYGRKTATRPHEYRNLNFPKHFTKTRCVFADNDGYCELEKISRNKGIHPWTFKPATCWLFPLGVKNGEVQPPPANSTDDPFKFDGYDGYVTKVPCGQHQDDGDDWKISLSKEIKYFEKAKNLPILGSENNEVNKLLKKLKP